jgi:hypothetical protein
MAVPELRARTSFFAAIGRVPALRAILQALAVGLGTVALAVGGIWLGLRLATAGTYPSALGTASFQVDLSSRGP